MKISARNERPCYSFDCSNCWCCGCNRQLRRQIGRRAGTGGGSGSPLIAINATASAVSRTSNGYGAPAAPSSASSSIDYSLSCVRFVRVICHSYVVPCPLLDRVCAWKHQACKYSAIHCSCCSQGDFTTNTPGEVCRSQFSMLLLMFYNSIASREESTERNSSTDPFTILSQGNFWKVFYYCGRRR